MPNHTKGLTEQLVTIAIAHVTFLSMEMGVNIRPSENQMIIAPTEKGEQTMAEYIEREQTRKAASDFVEAIKMLAENPQSLENMQSYLAQHFPEWLEAQAAREKVCA